MTALDLIRIFDSNFALNKWPKTFNVTHETYANCCQFVINDKAHIERGGWATIAVGEHNGLMFKNVELILQE